MAGGERAKFDNKVIDWIDERLPLFTLMKNEYGTFPTPKNFNYFWNFGALAFFMLITMIVSGIFLAMHFTPHIDHAFPSIERIMRDVNWGWMIRYIHMNGASMFFIAVYIHIYRGMYYGSYKNPRELLWILGVVIFLLMMATAFMGYSMTMSQMGGWAANVILNLVTAVPVVGDDVLRLIQGNFYVSNETVNRFFVLHYLLPFVIVGVVFLHIVALHITGSNNPTGIEPKGPQDTVPFHPYYTTKDVFGLGVFLILYAYLVFYAPLMLTHADHFVEYDPLVTPPHIVPEWYFLPFYAILRSMIYEGLFTPLVFLDWIGITAKLLGVLAMIGSIAILFVLPWLDKHPVRSARYRPLYQKFFIVWALNVVLLGYLGALTADATILGIPAYLIGQVSTVYYFAFFIVILPVLSKVEKAKPLPSSISEAVLEKNKSKGATKK